MTSLKNLAIVAHVDHGKTTLVDGLLKQSGVFDERAVLVERVMDSGELEKERGITIRAKNCSLHWKGWKVNLLDTPGHSDFGGEVERSLMMVDGVLLLVDAAEGPLPQTRFVLQKALEQRVKIGVILNKIDRPDQRVEEVKQEVEDLLLDLASLSGIEDLDLDIPFLYASGKNGWAITGWDDKRENLHPLLDFMVSDFYPSPRLNPGTAFQLLVSNLAYSPYMGPQMIGKIQRGTAKKGDNLVWIGEDKQKTFKVTQIQAYEGLEQKELETILPGDIVIISGLDSPSIGDTLCSSEAIEPLPRIKIEPPTVSVQVSVNTSPFSGKEGEYLTSRKLEEFLQEACHHNVALKYERTEDSKVFILKGRGELQLAIVFEEMRRQNNEFMVSRPEVILKTGENGETLEPYERLVLDIPMNCTGAITEALSQRKGKMESMSPLGENRTRMEFTVPSRSLIGYRSQFLTDTKGEGLISSYFLGYFAYTGAMLARQNGSLIADRTGKTTPYALFNLLSAGKQFIRPGQEVYEGMVVGEHTRTNDLNVNAVREKHVSSVRTAGKDENIILPPIPDMNLDFALSWIDQDEWVEVTPKNVRIRKKMLEQNKRTVIRKGE